jgi:hypothetical protein
MSGVLNPTPARIDLIIKQGTDWFYPIAVKNQAGSLLDLTGWTASAMVRADPDQATPSLTFAVALAGATPYGTAPNQYNVELYVADNVSAGLSDWGKGLWGLELQDSFGNRATVAEGIATFSRDVVW